MSEHRTTDVLVAFGVGALVGATAALLLAPAPGDVTRRRIGEVARKAAERTRTEAERARKLVVNQARRVEHAVEEGKQAYLRESQPA